MTRGWQAAPLVLSLFTAPAWGQVAATAPASHVAHATVQPSAPEIEAFLSGARAATSRYHDHAVALRDGFQPVGVETPGMGQHWVSPGRVLRGDFNVARPAGLQYATVSGRLTLVGVAYIVTLLEGEQPPAFPGPHVWHMHAKTVDEETLVADHDAAVAGPGPRVAVLHAWAWMENPAGPFTPDNWSLPFVRASLNPPRELLPAVARAVALATNGSAHFTSIIQRYAEPSRRDSAVIATAVAAAAAEARSAMVGSGDELTSAQSAALSATWAALWRDLESTVDPAVRARLSALKASTFR